MNPKLSVIVPIYNTLPYLRTCLDSIKRQTYSPLEVILVDDGSSDGSSEFCDKYIELDERFQVIHKKNGGLSSARNAGIEVATGQLITFVDSDDALIGQPYNFLIPILQKYSAQIVCMDNYCSSDSPYDLAYSVKDEVNIQMDNISFFEKICAQTLSEAAWDKIYDRSLFEKVRFRTGMLNEDFLLMIELCKTPMTIVKTNYLGYYYFQRMESITHSGFKKNMIDAVYNANYAYEHAPNDVCKKAAEGYLLHRILMYLINMPNDYVKIKNKDYLFVMMKLKSLNVMKSNRSVRDKILLKFFSMCPQIANLSCSLYLKKGKSTT